MKRVLIPLALVDRGLNESGIVRSSYTEKLIKFGILPILVSPHTPWHMVESLYTSVDGVLFTGGPDIAPSYYGTEPHPETEVGPEGRDRFEFRLVPRIVRDRKPFLGICRGKQMLAVGLGGTLRQHVPDHFPHETHSRLGAKDYAEWVQERHDVLLTPGSRIATICGAVRVVLNSAHHQAVDNPGPQLLVTGKSPEGCVEVVEHVDAGYFCLGIQAHPEAMIDDHAHKIFEAFRNAL